MSVKIPESIKQCLNLDLDTKEVLEFISDCSSEEDKDGLKVFEEAKSNLDGVSYKLGVADISSKKYYADRMDLINSIDDNSSDEDEEEVFEKIDANFGALTNSITKKFNKAFSVNESYHDVSGDPEDEDTFELLIGIFHFMKDRGFAKWAQGSDDYGIEVNGNSVSSHYKKILSSLEELIDAVEEFDEY
jgi:hypothetical protein